MFSGAMRGIHSCLVIAGSHSCGPGGLLLQRLLGLCSFGGTVAAGRRGDPGAAQPFAARRCEDSAACQFEVGTGSRVAGECQAWKLVTQRYLIT